MSFHYNCDEKKAFRHRWIIIGPQVDIVCSFPVKQRSAFGQFYSINYNQNMQIMRFLYEINTGR
jgi:hypothetical protein